MSPPFHSDPVAHLDDGFHALADTDARARAASWSSVSSEDSASTRWPRSWRSLRRRCFATGGLPRPGFDEK
jgi:hypothetical protein